MLTTRKLFLRYLRKEVMDSYQIKGENKLVYMTSLKCASLRMMNKQLAPRLELPCPTPE